MQVMENDRDDLVVIFAGYKDRMETFFSSNPGFAFARRAPHRLSRTTRPTNCSRSRHLMLERLNYELLARSRERAFATTWRCGCASRSFANARSVRNAI